MSCTRYASALKPKATNNTTVQTALKSWLLPFDFAVSDTQIKGQTKHSWYSLYGHCGLALRRLREGRKGRERGCERERERRGEGERERREGGEGAREREGEG
eukprot:3765901-Rhodomonas_salina.2